MTFTKEDKRDLLKLADIIEKKEFFNKRTASDELKILPEDKRDGSQFNLQDWFFACGMPACAAGHAVCNFPERFGYFGCIIEKREDKSGKTINVDHYDFAEAFNISEEDTYQIADPDEYRGGNPRPKTVANRIRMIVKRQEIKP